MNNTKNLGIWMDHANASLMEYIAGSMESTVVASPFTENEKESSLAKSEHTMHNKKQQQQAGYYKQLGEVIKNYNSVILFGPTDAKTELFNLLKEDRHFDNIKIEVKGAGKMTENQQHAFVREYFSQH